MHTVCTAVRRSPRRLPRQAGFALPSAILAIVIIGALIAGAFYTSMQEMRIGRAANEQDRALAAAERGMNAVLPSWDTSWNRRITAGRDTIITVSASNGGASTRVHLTRLNLTTFLATSEAKLTANGSRRRTGTLIHLNIPSMSFPGTITAAGTTYIGGSSIIAANDSTYPGWDCPPQGPPRPGVMDVSTTNVNTTGNCASGACITGTSNGSSRVVADPQAGADSTYFNYSGFSWSDLASKADKVYDPSVVGQNSESNIGPSYSGSNCDYGGSGGLLASLTQSQRRNWGDPTHDDATTACDSYYPIVYVKAGNFTVGGGAVGTAKGQGILLVEGNLTIAGNFEFTGPIIVKGNVYVSGTGNKVWGGIMARNSGCTSTGTGVTGSSSTQACNQITGTITVQYSR